jgi:PAS domain S-box-containing protein
MECTFKTEASALFLARLAAMSRAVRVRKRMAAEHQRLAGILGSVGDGVYGVNRSGQITFINPAARNILGYGDEDHLIGRAAHKMFHHTHEDRTANPPEDCLLQQAYSAGNELRAWSTVFWHKSGMPIPVECTVYRCRSRAFEGSVGVPRYQSDASLNVSCGNNHDPLTKRTPQLFEAAESEVSRLKRAEVSTLVYLDLDRFKHINDTAGHWPETGCSWRSARSCNRRIRDCDMLAPSAVTSSPS